MAFVNERMTQAERESFIERKIPAPTWSLCTLRSSKWTIDHERNMFLVWASQPRDDHKGKTYFVFGWNEIYIPMLLLKTWLDDMSWQWSLVEIKIPKDLIEQKQEIVSSIKEALTIYGYEGSPDYPNNNIYTIKFDF